jgi:hypothetical protein
VNEDLGAVEAAVLLHLVVRKAEEELVVGALEADRPLSQAMDAALLLLANQKIPQ